MGPLECRKFRVFNMLRGLPAASGHWTNPVKIKKSLAPIRLKNVYTPWIGLQ